MIRVMVVDDGAEARERLARIIGEESAFEVVSSVSDGAEAIKFLKSTKVDVAFLDVEMPKMSGLELASKIAHLEAPPLVVFVTAYDQYAVQAFEAHAIDYILKPFREDRLSETLVRIKEKLETQDPIRDRLLALETQLCQMGKLKRIVATKRGSKTRMMVDPSQVLYFEAHLKEVYVHLAESVLIANATLAQVRESLDPSAFIQTHRAYVVNLEHIERVEPMFKGDYVIAMKGKPGVTVPLSRSYVPKLKQHLPTW